MGKLTRLSDVVFTDTTGPKLITRDKLESDGSLFLFDGNHPHGLFTGLPPVNSRIPNVLSNKASALLGILEANTHFVVAQVAGLDSAVFKRERTGKGGIHGLITQAGGQVSLQNYFLRAAPSIQEHMRDNPTHVFYVSLWQTITRKAPTGTVSPQAPFYFTNGVAATANFRFHMEGSIAFPRVGTTPNKGTKVVPAVSDNDIANGTNRFTSLAVQGNTGNGPVSADAVTFGVGTNAAWNGANYNKAASRIIYRAYVEDLTVSGRTYAEVEAIDYAMYQEAFGLGGKFSQDTYTAVNTLP